MHTKLLLSRALARRGRASGALLGLLTAALLLLAAIAASAGQAEQSSSNGFLVAKGRTTFRVYCANCHGPAGRGNGVLAEMLRVPPADLTVLTRDSEDGKYPREDVHAAIDGREVVKGHGARDMPIWGDAFQKVLAPGYQDLSDEERAQLKIVELVYFIESIQELETLE